MTTPMEPFGYFCATPFGWIDCAETEPGAKALYEITLGQDVVAKIADAIHYLRCWDTAAYPDLFSALIEITVSAGCSECKPQAEQEPVFWYRPTCNGEMYEGPVHNSSIMGKMLRDEKPGEWKPLYPHPAPDRSAEIDTMREQVRVLSEALKQLASDKWNNQHWARGIAFEALAAVKLASTSQAVADVLAERRRQVESEGWTPEHDDENGCGSLASAAACYAAFTKAYPVGDPPRFWPWDKSWWKPSEDSRRNFVKAGALILAEIERLDRATVKPAGQEGGAS